MQCDFNAEKFVTKRLHQLWSALPRGWRLRIAILSREGMYEYSKPISEAVMLSFYNRVVVRTEQSDREIKALLSCTDGLEARLYKIQ